MTDKISVYVAGENIGSGIANRYGDIWYNDVIYKGTTQFYQAVVYNKKKTDSWLIINAKIKRSDSVSSLKEKYPLQVRY
mgnify:CR=1 FL=1|tara:strand:- start:38 stop:274 length:237 start_codon:yes stop_codon:yes gene_type:complete